MKKEKIIFWIENILFSSKYFLVPFYFGLMVALAYYIIIYAGLFYNFWMEPHNAKSSSTMFILELIDMAMIAALVRMIIIGGYTSFICKEHSDSGEKASSGVLKVKLSTAIIGVSSIGLLQIFMTNAAPIIAGHENERISWEIIQQLLWIHCVFLVGALVLAVIDFLHVKSECLHHTIEGGNTIDVPHHVSEVCTDIKKTE